MAVYNSIQLDLCKKNSYKAIPTKQLDTNSRFLRVELLNNGSQYDFNDDVTVILASTRNGETKAYKCTVEDGCVVAPLTSWMLAEEGYVDCEIVLVDTASNSKLSSFAFSICIDESIYNDETITQDENYSVLLQLITGVDTAVKSCNTATEKATEIYNTVETKLNNGELKGEKGDKGDKGDTYELTAQDKRDIINQIPNASPSQRGVISVPWGCGILVDEDGAAKVRYPVTEITSTTDDIKVKVHTGGTTDGRHDLTFNSEKYAKKTELPKKTSDLQNDSNFVSDKNYVHTDNNFTAAEKQKLGTLSNYDDTAIKKQIAGKQDKLSTAQLNNISAVPNKQDKLTAEQLSNISAVPNKQDKVTYDLICDMTVDENNQIIGSDNRPYVEITTDLNGKSFNYQKVLINIVFPSTISTTIYPYVQIANRSGSFGNVFGYGTKNVKIINGTVERLPNALFDCNFIFQTSDYYGNYKISTLNADKYLIQSDGITKIRFMLRQTDMTIPTGTTIKIWGIN